MIKKQEEIDKINEQQEVIDKAKKQLEAELKVYEEK